jgi:predicted PurR-regulated permease PerM
MQRLSSIEFAKRAAIVVSLAMIPLLVWVLADLILIVIVAVLVGILLHLVAKPFRWLYLPQAIALSLSGIVIVCALTAAGYLFGKGVASEFQDVLARAQAAEGALTAALHGSEFGKMILSHMEAGGISLSDFVGGIIRIGTNFLIGLVVAVFAGIFFAAQPSVYRDGFSSLFPLEWRGRVNETLNHIASALQLWLLGQMIEMLLVGVLVGVAVSLIGLPSRVALAAIAGLAEFIPYVGPILAIIPSALVAVTVNLPTLFWTLVAFIAIHQLEGNLAMPIIQRQMVRVPPAVMLLSIVAINYLFGPAATILGGPITVILFVVVNKLYIHDTLEEAVMLPADANRGTH